MSVITGFSGNLNRNRSYDEAIIAMNDEVPSSFFAIFGPRMSGSGLQQELEALLPETYKQLKRKGVPRVAVSDSLKLTIAGSSKI